MLRFMRRVLGFLAASLVCATAGAQPLRPNEKPGMLPRDRLPMKSSDLPSLGQGLPRQPDPAVRPGAWLGALPAADEAFLKDLVATRSFRLGRPTQLRFTPDGRQLLFLRAEPRSPSLRLHVYDLATRQTREIVTAAALLNGGAESISPEERARRERLRLLDTGITDYALFPDGKHVLVALAGRAFAVELATGKPRELAGPDSAGQPVFDARLSPDGAYLGFVRGGELWVVSAGALPTPARQLTKGATESLVHAQAEYIAQEEMARTQGWWWSADGKSLLVEEYDQSKVETLAIADPARPGNGAQTLRYPRPGKANVDARLMLIPRAGGKSTDVAWDHTRYPYLAKVTWQAGGPPTIVVQTRDQREVVVLAVDPATGKTRPLITERDDAWVNLDVYALEHDRRDVLASLDHELAWLPDGSGFLWASERGGAWQLELHGREGGLLKTLTTPAQGFRGLRAWSADKRAVQVVLGKSPTVQEVWSIPLDGGAPKALATGPGLVDATFADASAAHAITRWGWDRAYDVAVVDAAGVAVGALPSIAVAPPFTPKVDVVELPGAITAAVVRPRRPGGARKLPVLVDVYGGPGTVFAPVARWRFIIDQWIADHGFVVVRIDGRGTPARDRAHERAIRGKLGAVPLEDQVAGLRALAARDSSLDLTRVGIFGHSFGGYLAALAAIARPDVFDAAVAAAPVTDWLDYDTHYTERYLGVPTGDDDATYAANSVTARARELTRPLLLVHGTADDNVHLSHSLDLADALLRAGRKPELLLLAGETHAFRDPVLLLRYYQRVFAFFRENLR